MLLGGGFGSERVVGVQEAQDVLVLVVAVRPQQREQAVPALPQFGHLSRIGPVGVPRLDQGAQAAVVAAGVAAVIARSPLVLTV